MASLWALQLLVPADRSLFARVEAAIAGGVTLVQLREKERADGETYRVGLALRDLVRHCGAAFFVNDRPDLALALDADGVHVGQDDLPVAVVRRLAPGLLIGASSHDTASALAVRDADYVAFGPVFPTPSKDDADPPTGVPALQAAARVVGRPLVAIGGITVERAGELAQTGIAGVAVISAILGAPDPGDAARRLRWALGL